MPYTENENGELTYEPGNYMKEELPTWDEMYNEFYTDFWLKAVEHHDPTMLMYISGHDIKLDPYYKIPRKKVLLAKICNQLNKMLKEDGWESTIVGILNSIYMDKIPTIITHVEFCLYPGTTEFTPNGIPVVYTINNSNGLQDPFLETSEAKRISVNDMDDFELMMITTEVAIRYDDENNITEHPDDWLIPENSTYMMMTGLSKIIPDSTMAPIRKGMLTGVVGTLFQDVIEYFKLPIGWKDTNGNLLDSTNVAHPFDPSMDPAL